MAQTLLPDSDISVSGTWNKTWTPSESPFGPFSTYYEHVNRTTTDNWGWQITTSSAAGVVDSNVVGLQNPGSTPDSTGTITVYVRAFHQGTKSSNAGTFMVYLLEGTTVKGSYDLGANITAGTRATKSFTVAASSISDWTNLRIKFEHTRDTNRDRRPTWVYVEVPDAVATNVTVNATVSDTTVDDGAMSLEISSSVTSTVTNTTVTGKQPIVATDGGAVIGAEVTSTSVAAANVTVTVTREVTQTTLVTNIAVSGKSAAIQTEEHVVTFIPIDDTSLTAADADQLESFDLGALLFNQEKVFALKLGNVGLRTLDITLSVTSANDSIVDLVQFSSDKQNYSSTITIESVPSNGVTDPVWIKFSPVDASPGEGTFLINLEQSNA